MALILDSWVTELVVALSTVFLGLYLWYQHGFQYWKRKGVRYIEPSFPFGNLGKSLLFQQAIGPYCKEMHDSMKGERFVGIYSFRRPVLLVRDPDLLRQMLVKDFQTFTDRGFFLDEEEPLLRHLFFLSGSEWHRLRVKLSPTFTSGRLKAMFNTIQNSGSKLVEVLEKKAISGEEVPTRDVVARFTTDVIMSVGFGVETNCQIDPKSEVREWGRKVFAPAVSTALSFLLSMVSPHVARYLKIKGGVTEISKMFQKLVRDTVSYRERNNVTRKDFMDLLIQLKNKGFVEGEKLQNGLNAEENKLPMEHLFAQAFAFFGAGFETSSSTISFTLHELALHPDIQRKLQQEIDSILEDNAGEISYDSINKMTYLRKVVNETLRKYPPLPILNRICNKDYKIPDSDVVLDKGTLIFVSLLGLQNDPEHFPDPERYDPERFNDDQVAKRHPYTYMPFGEGPRICIGMRLGLLQTQIGLVNILSNFSVKPVKETEGYLPYTAKSVMLTTTSEIKLKFEARH